MLKYHVLDYVEYACIYWRAHSTEIEGALSGNLDNPSTSFTKFESILDCRKDSIIKKIHELSLEDVASIKLNAIMEEISDLDSLKIDNNDVNKTALIDTDDLEKKLEV